MAVTGDLINKANIGSGVAYNSAASIGGIWSYVFANSIYFKGWTGAPSSIYESNPNARMEFWRYSISQQQWLQLYAYNIAQNSNVAFRVRCNQNPTSGTIHLEYNGDDSYLFAFMAQRTAGEVSRSGADLYVYNIGGDTTYDTTVKGKLIYGRSEDKAYDYMVSTAPASYNLTQNWLTTTGMRGQLITAATIKRMISVKSAVSHT